MLQRIKYFFGLEQPQGEPSKLLDNQHVHREGAGYFAPDKPQIGNYNPYFGYPPWFSPQMYPLGGIQGDGMRPGMPTIPGCPPYYGYPYPAMMHPVSAQQMNGALISHTPSTIQIQPPSTGRNGIMSLTVKPEPITERKLGQPNTVQDPNPENDWPNGDERREYIDKAPRTISKWVWRSAGTTSHDGRRVEYRRCQGILVCTNPDCERQTRPKTQKDSMDVQVAAGCPLCHSTIIQKTCAARTYHFDVFRDGQKYAFWDHEGYHLHERPPSGGSLSDKEKAQVDIQVSRNPTAFPHALRTGDTFPGSVPLANIAPKLANPRVAQYQVSQSQTRLGISPASASRGGLSVLRSLANLQQELETPFIVDSCVHGPTFLSFQTPFMKETLENSIDSWSNEMRNQENHLTGRHGFVTDGDHTFFREGVLNVTCVFHPVMLAWILVLYTLILRQDIAHHRPHFCQIQQTLVAYLLQRRLKFESYYFLHVFDFSAAQRSAHAEEYVDAVISMTPGFHDLLKPAQDAQRLALLQQATEAQRGCSFHFWQSAERIQSNGNLVPHHTAPHFNHLLHILVDEGTSKEEFNNTVATLHADYPSIFKWLEWWLRPNFRVLIFPVHRSMDAVIAEEVPRTSNAAEHSHSLLHHSVGSDQDLIPGIKKLFLHVKALEVQFKSIKGGHYGPAPPRAYRPPAKPKWAENDGLAPDTETALNPAPNLASSTASVNKNLLLSYKWLSPNSCFVDNGLEIWFRAYSCWPNDLQAKFRTSIPSDTFLSSLFYHYERRLKHLSESASTTVHIQNLGLMQTLTLNCVFNKWKLYSDPNEFGCAKTWITRAVQDGNPSMELQEYFGVTYHVVRECTNGHYFSTSISKVPEVWFTINDCDMKSAHSIFGNHVTTSDYFRNHIPRSRGGNYEGGTTPIHLLPIETCADPSCNVESFISSVSTHWPQIFNVNADILRSDPHKIQFESRFSIPDQNGPVTYELIGRIIHVNTNHFVSQLRFEGKCYDYNDMQNGGHLQASNNIGLLEEENNFNSVCYIYNRSSSKAKTMRLSIDIQADYDRYSIPEPVITNLSSPEPIVAPAVKPSAKLAVKSQTEVSNSQMNTASLSLGAYFPEPYTLCDACSLSEPDASHPFRRLLVTCTLCEKVWHEDCVDINDTDASLDDTWGCPACINPQGGQWDKLMLREFILLKPKPSARFYPAKVLGRSSTHKVHVEWYSGNIYQDDDDPLVTCSIFTPLQCLHAKNCDYFFEYTKENLGTIRWPVRLEEDALEKYNYKNSNVRKILEGAYGAILEVMLGTRDHPIIHLYKDWIANRPRSVKMIIRHQYEFTQQFRLDVLPADLSLIDPFLQYLRQDTANTAVYVDSHWIENIAFILFRLAIIRLYLGRHACDDEQIFYLAYTGFINSHIAPDDVYLDAKQGILKRLLTLPERAMGASGSMRTLGVHISLECQVDNCDFLDNTKLLEACMAKGGQYTFFNTTSRGMSGGPQFVPNRRIEQPTGNTRKPTNQERPKPKPRARAAKSLVPKGVRVITPAPAVQLLSLKRGLDTEAEVPVRRSKRNKTKPS